MTNKCPHNCSFCFTDKNKKTLNLKEIKNIIDQLVKYNTKAIQYVGEGEPTIDPDFLKIIEYTVKKNIQPIIYTDAATMLLDKKLLKKLNDLKVSIMPKMDSLYNEKYQNFVVGDKTKTYFKKRNQAIQLLIKSGFNKIEKDGTTRLGFDMVICKKNKSEIFKLLRWCRKNNVYLMLSSYLPSGRSADENFDNSLELSEKELNSIFKKIKKIDSKEFNYDHEIYSNYVFCGCVEFLQIYGDGRVSPCPGSDIIVGNIKKEKLSVIISKINKRFPKMDISKRDGHCIFRSFKIK